MKRKVMAWTAAVLIVALVSVAFLVPADPNPDFGMVAELYYLNGTVEPITDCVGDTHILTAVSTEWDDDLMGEISIRFSGDSDKRYAYNAGWYVDGKLIPSDDGDTPKGGIEKLVDGEWVWYRGIAAVYDAYIHTMFPPPFDTVAAGETLSFSFPHNDPGTYRITFTLREAYFYLPGMMGSEPPRYATGEEVYTISHTYTVPEPTHKHFDLLGVAADVSDYRREQGYDASVVLLIRNNDGFHFYQDLSRGKLEKMIDGEWVDVTAAQNNLLDLPYCDELDDGRVMLANISVKEFYRTMHIDDLSADYRITLEFVENEDGSGERYALQFCMNFSEEG